MTAKELTLRRRKRSLNLPDRDRSLTLKRRSRSLTLPDRPISGGATAGNIGRSIIYLGFNPSGSLNPFVFLSYGLIGNLYESDPTSTLTLRRRKRSLTLE